jgi:hypothetical protein
VAPPQRRAVEHVVVHQRGHVEQLHGHGRGHQPGIRVVRGREEHEHRPQPLAAGGEHSGAVALQLRPVPGQDLGEAPLRALERGG